MAYNYLDKTGLALVWEKIKNALAGKVDKVDGKGLSTNDYTSNEKTKLSGIASGAQVNVLEGIQKNGTAVTITNKIANISVPTKTSDITNDSGFITSADVPEGAAASITTPKMNGTAAVGTETAFARGDHIHPTDTSRASASSVTTLSGRVDTLEEAVGTGGSVDEKDGTIALVSDIPTNNNQLTNGAGFQTASDVNTLISSALTTVMDYKGTVAAVANLPTTGNKNGDVYHVTATDGEYAWNGTEWEELGSTIDLSGYVEDTDMTAITSTEINTICV